MCGRYSIYDIMRIQARFNVKLREVIRPIYNASPSMELPIITNLLPDTITVARWGISLRRDQGYKMINAREETIQEKPAYKTLFKERRCLIPANSFFEWKDANVKKIPYLIRRKDREMFAFAGIWDTCIYENKEAVSFSIITKESDGIIRSIHDRMPVIISRKDEIEWLRKPELAILRSSVSDKLMMYQVDTSVNSPANNDQKILDPARTLDSFYGG